MKTFKIFAKHNDIFDFTIKQDGKTLKEFNNNYSDFSDSLNIGSSDDLDFEIDINTGKILNWNKQKALEIFNENKPESKKNEKLNKKEVENFSFDKLDLKILPSYGEYFEKTYSEIKSKLEHDDNFYISEFKRIQTEIAIYKGMNFLDCSDDVYGFHILDQTEIPFSMYCLMVVVEKLLSNNIPTVLKKIDIPNGLKYILYIKPHDRVIAEKLLTENGLYDMKPRTDYHNRQPKVRSLKVTNEVEDVGVYVDAESSEIIQDILSNTIKILNIDIADTDIDIDIDSNSFSSLDLPKIKKKQLMILEKYCNQNDIEFEIHKEPEY